uniref:TonB family protein n=1 Tax=Rhodopseudomonas palustris (strain BisA53) TaxID=316055 RepID=Q07N98_RHOP5
MLDCSRLAEAIFHRIAWRICRAGLLAAAVPLIAPAFAASDPIVFDIPAQSLNTALETYSIATGREVVYHGGLAAGRKSSRLKGSYAAEVALKLLLEGTGMTPRYMADDAFVLVPGAATGKLSLTAETAPAAVSDYYGQIQAGIRDAICAHPRTEPGEYRIVVSFWIGTSGTVSRAELLGSSGDRMRDDAIVRTIRNLSIAKPPPSGFAQPITLMIAPVFRDVMSGCPVSGVPVKLQP